MQQQHPPVDKGRLDALTRKVLCLDVFIDRVSHLFNFSKFDTGTLMLTGIDGRPKETGELITWSPAAGLPVPITRIRQFLEGYCQDLIAERNVLMLQIERLKSELNVFGSDPGQPVAAGNGPVIYSQSAAIGQFEFIDNPVAAGSDPGDPVAAGSDLGQPVPGTSQYRPCDVCKKVTLQRFGFINPEIQLSESGIFICLTCETVQP